MRYKHRHEETLRIAMFGSSGRVGSAIAKKLFQKAEQSTNIFIVVRTRESLDLSQPKLVYDWLVDTQPNILLNVAFSRTGDSHRDWLINVGSADAIAKYAAIYGACLIQLGCCHVFEGYRADLIREGLHESYPCHVECRNSFVHVARENVVLSLASKKQARQTGFRYFLLRPGIIIGSSTKVDPLLSNCINLLERYQPVLRIRNTAVCSLISLELLASCIEKIIDRYQQMESGIYHVAAGGSCTETQLIQELSCYTSCNPIIIPPKDNLEGDIEFCSSGRSGSMRYMVLNCSKFEEQSGIGPLPDWKKDLERCSRDLRKMA